MRWLELREIIKLGQLLASTYPYLVHQGREHLINFRSAARLNHVQEQKNGLIIQRDNGTPVILESISTSFYE